MSTHLVDLTVLEGPLIPPVSTRVVITFREFGGLEVHRVLSVETMYYEITPKEGLLTLSHFPIHLAEKIWPLRILAGSDYNEVPGIPLDPTQVRAWPLTWLLRDIRSQRRYAIVGWAMNLALLRKNHWDDMAHALSNTPR